MTDTGAQANSVVDRLHAITAIVHRADAPLGAWFAAAVREHLETGVPLDVALGLRGNGQLGRSERYRALEARRNAHLAQAYALLDGSPWAKARALSAAVKRFESGLWVRVRFDPAPPARATALERALFGAFKCGIGVPQTAQGLRDALK